MFDLMTTVSLLVDDLEPAVEALVRSIGLPQPRATSYRSGPGIEAVFCRVHPKYAVAPTFLELIAAGPVDTAPDENTGQGHVFPMVAISARHGDRPIKWHATEIAMPETQMLELAEHLERLGVAVGFVPPDRRERFFLGGDPGSSAYDSTADSGLLIEAGRSGHLGLSEDDMRAPADIPADAQPETMVRIVAREYLVEDIDETLGIVERHLNWSPASVEHEAGSRRAVMPFKAPRSARLELVQPTGSGPVADTYERLGPGAWTIRISVVDVGAKAKDLAAHGTRFSLEGGILRPDPRFTWDVPFAFVTA